MSTTKQASDPTPKEQAEWEGNAAGTAARDQDWPRARLHLEWFGKFLRLQPRDSRRELQQVFDDAYKKCNWHRPEPFI